MLILHKNEIFFKNSRLIKLELLLNDDFEKNITL